MFVVSARVVETLVSRYVERELAGSKSGRLLSSSRLIGTSLRQFHVQNGQCFETRQSAIIRRVKALQCQTSSDKSKSPTPADCVIDLRAIEQPERVAVDGVHDKHESTAGQRPTPSTRVESRKLRKLRRLAIQEGTASNVSPLSIAKKALKRHDNKPQVDRMMSLLKHFAVSKDNALSDMLMKHNDKNKSTINKRIRDKAEHKDEENTRPAKETWQIQKAALGTKFKDQKWEPRKRISPDAIAGVRSLHSSDPQMYSTERLSNYFQISPESVRRILKGKWQPNEDQARDRQDRWQRRGERKWSDMVKQGIRPPKKWRDLGVGKDIVETGEEKSSWRKTTDASTANGTKVDGRRKGERWVEHRSPEELFAHAAHTSTSREADYKISDRIM